MEHAGPSGALALQRAHSGYFERMAHARRPDSARVPIGLKVSETDAARIDLGAGAARVRRVDPR